jgi:hypothetical protein
MDERTKAIYEAKCKQIDIALAEEIEEIENNYSKDGLQSSGRLIAAKGRAEGKAKAQKDELKVQLSPEHKGATDKKGGLSINKNKGLVSYTSFSGKTYRTGKPFSVNSNSFQMLVFLAENPNQAHSAEAIEEWFSK